MYNKYMNDDKNYKEDNESSLEIVQIGDEPREISDVMIDWVALSEGLPDNYADWLPFLVFGIPYVKIAQVFGIDKSTITNALKYCPDLARRVSQGRNFVKRQLHYVWLDQKAVTAWKNIDYYLGIDPYEKDEGGKFIYPEVSERRVLLQEKAKMTRFVLQQLGLHVQRHEVVHHTPQPMFLGDSILAEHVVNKIKEIVSLDSDRRDVETISAEFRVLAGKEMITDADVDADEGEAESNPPYSRRAVEWKDIEE